MNNKIQLTFKLGKNGNLSAEIDKVAKKQEFEKLKSAKSLEKKGDAEDLTGSNSAQNTLNINKI